MKKIIFLLLTTLSSMAANAHDIEVPNGDGVTIYYNFTNDSTELEVTYRGDNYIPFEYTGNVIIPEEVTYMNRIYKVTSIGNWTFYDCGLISITIPNSVTSIGENAFAFCSGLTSVTIPNSVTSIGKKAFYGCFGLTSVTIPNSITSIGSGVFQSCSGLTSIVIPNSVTRIGDSAFYSCSGLTSVTIGNSVTSIGDNAFAYCSCLTSVTIPNSVTSIGGSAFEQCDSLASITIPNSVTSIGSSAFYWCSCLTSVTIPNSLTSIDSNVFCGCASLTSITIPNSVKSISGGAFRRCSSLTSVTIPNSVTSIDIYAFADCYGLTSVTIGNNVMNIGRNAFSECSVLTSVTVLNPTPIAIKQNVFTSRKNATLYVPAASIDAYRNVSPWNEFGAIVPIEDQVAYRPFIEEGKSWKVGTIPPNIDSPVQIVDYYYLDGDTIIDGKTCKQMMCQRYVNADYAEVNSIPQDYPLSYEGAWYEENKKVFVFDSANNQFVLKYDFSVNDNDWVYLIDNYPPFIIGPKQTGGMEGFKGVYRDVMWYDEEEPYYNTTWLEGVGGIEGPIFNIYYGKEYHPVFLMSCSVGDEVIYLNDKYEDGASLDVAGARKDRFDFTHTVKVEPKTPRRSQGQEPLYGEYNNLQLDIHLDLLDDAYLVCIIDESGKAVYQKAINAGSIVGLNIDISAYAKGRYTVTMENSLETFTGEFEVQTTGIEEVTYNNKVKASNTNFNLQGQRISSLQKGLNIVNGRKVVIK